MTMVPKILPFFCVNLVLFIHIAGAAKKNCNKEENLYQRCSMALPVLSSPDISFALTREELDKSCVKGKLNLAADVLSRYPVNPAYPENKEFSSNPFRYLSVCVSLRSTVCPREPSPLTLRDFYHRNIELEAGTKCIDNYTDVCMEKNEAVMFRKIYSGIRDVVKDLCTRGTYQEEYLKHAVCVKNVRPEYEVCSKKYEVTLTAVSSHHNKDQYNTDVANKHEDHLRAVCCSFQEFLSCSERTVQMSCGDEAALFTSAFLRRMASNIIKNFCLEYHGQECEMSGSGTAFYHNPLLPVTTISLLVNSILAPA